MKSSLLHSALVVAGLYLGSASGARAQQRPAAFPAPTPTPTEDPTRRRGAGHAGSYQGLDGVWHQVQIEGWENDRVYMSDAGNTYQAYGPAELKRFVVLGDTIAAARDVAVPRRRFLRRPRTELLPALFGRQLYRGGGFQLLDYDSSRPATLTSALSSRLLLRRGTEAWQVLPTNTAKFNQRMLVLLGSDPELAAGLQTGQYRPRRDAAELLERYADRRTRQFLKSAVQPVR